MTNEPHSGRTYEAEDAALAQAGPAQSLSDEKAAPRTDVQPDERQRMLDEREEKLARRRKPMGPTSDQIPETTPEEAAPPSDEQPSTTPEPLEP
ncbi:hypothetical protein [Streptomyces cyanogenus]|uniref:Uncharacterized protein n=1 Tax=Streptomyces cyanogenus TaxID=80860 RepID=A0ABX7TKC6_STRCY|nr:hypothetical protein [Streptomyces cyanogenus]QTD96048.1 hypothetical protein S1361_01755 [Streptomyces cyanogenus]